MAPEQRHSEDERGMVCVGVITGARGLRGEVRVKSFTAEPSAIAGYGPLADETGRRHFRLAVVGGRDDDLVARIAGIGDRSTAEALKGERLYVPRSALPPPDEDEFYHVDLIGLAVVRAAGPGEAAGAIGHIADVCDFGAGPVLEVRCATGASLLIPFTRTAVPGVDIGGGRVLVADLPGLFAPAPDEPVPDAAHGGDQR